MTGNIDDRRSAPSREIESKLKDLDSDVRNITHEMRQQDNALADIRTSTQVLNSQMTSVLHNIEKLVTRVEYESLTRQLADMAKALEKLVTRHEFNPVRLLVFGMAGTLLAGIIGAVLSSVLRHQT